MKKTTLLMIIFLVAIVGCGKVAEDVKDETAVVTAPDDKTMQESSQETQEAIQDIENELSSLEDVDLELAELESLEEDLDLEI